MLSCGLEAGGAVKLTQLAGFGAGSPFVLLGGFGWLVS